MKIDFEEFHMKYDKSYKISDFFLFFLNTINCNCFLELYNHGPIINLLLFISSKFHYYET